MIQARARNPEQVSRGVHAWPGRKGVRRVQFLTSDDIFARLQDMAIADGLSLAALVRGLVCDGLAARQKSSGGAL